MTAATRGEGTATRFGFALGRAVRVGVAALLLAGLLGAALGAARSVRLSTLATDLDRGQVAEVVFSDSRWSRPVDLDIGEGNPERVVRWKVVGGGWRTADLNDGGFPAPALGGGPDPAVDGSDLGTDGVGTGTGGVEAEIRQRAQAAGVPLSGPGPGSVHRLVTLATITSALLVLVLIGSPQPRWATKWAWFWFMLVPGGLTQLAWVAVEAPWSSRANRRPEPLPHRDEPDDRRLTGGPALVLSLMLAALLGLAGTAVAGWLAG